jgi:tripartite-type tricarboxylate transporter receptor subunit TctC
MFSYFQTMKQRQLMRLALTSIFLTLSVLAPQMVRAQVIDWPQKPIKLVVPYTPGGSADALGRLIGDHLGRTFGQTVVMENRPGAGGIIGSQMVAKSPADGYTLVISGIGSHVIAPILTDGSYDPIKDFTHIAMLAGPPLAVVVNAEQPFKDFNGFINFIKNNPNGLSWGSPGQGTHGHLTGELFRTATNLNMVHINYKGASGAVVDLMGGQIAAGFMTLSSAKSGIESGKLRLLAVSSPKRLSEYPNVPTLAELGYPALTGTTWFALSGPAGMPTALVDRINAEVRRGMDTAAAKARLSTEIMQTVAYDAPEFKRYVSSEVERLGPAVRALKNSIK